MKTKLYSFILLFITVNFLCAMEQSIGNLNSALTTLSEQLRATPGVPKVPVTPPTRPTTPIAPITPPAAMPPTPPIVPAASLGIPALRQGMLVRKDFVSDIVRNTEDLFRARLKWSKPPSLLLPQGNPWNELNGALYEWQEAQKNDWIKAYARRAAVFQGKFECLKIADLDARLRSYPSNQKGSLLIRIYDPLDERLADIRFLQAQHENKFANFQLASTFWGPLEGGMAMQTAKLEEMLARAVQGEHASVGCAGATIWRKYFMPTDFIRGQGLVQGYYYLLGALNVPFNIFGRTHRSPAIDKNMIPNVASLNKNNMMVGIHRDIVVTSGWGPYNIAQGRPSENDSQERLQVALLDGVSVDTAKTQIITQLFTSAYSLRSGAPSQQEIDLAQKILSMAYESTFKAAAYNALQDLSQPNRRKLYLTLLGGGSFRNDIAWIGQAIQSSVHLINQYGLNVTLIYRPDSRRDDANQEAFFIHSVFAWMNFVNEANGRYTLTDESVKELLVVFSWYFYYMMQKDYNNASAMAKRINNYLNQYYNFGN